ncbi:MAG: protein kinase [Deltaproteobacteria bacterium]|nr:protein kinase [Deltaproteobacteria bacterium]
MIANATTNDPRAAAPPAAQRIGPAAAIDLCTVAERHLGFRPAAVRVYEETGSFVAIDRGDALRLGGRTYLVTGTVREEGFGLEEQPKYWVKRAVDLATGVEKIVKLVFLEQFDLPFGGRRVRCFRSPAKEARLLDVVRGHPQFMAGSSVRDRVGNLVRVIDFIPGPSLERVASSPPGGDEAYVREELPRLLWRYLPCMEGLRFLHERGERHGDVRADHVIVDRGSGLLRWIDFDYDFECPGAPFVLDVHGAGSILASLVGRGAVDCHPGLGRFAAGSRRSYAGIGELIDDLGDALSGLVSPRGLDGLPADSAGSVARSEWRARHD